MLIFDFDGVLLNSVVEMSITAYNGVTGELATSPDELPGNAIDIFMTNRYHVQAAGDGLTLMQWCLAHADLPPDYRLEAGAYQDIKTGVKTPLAERTTWFFAARKRFVEHDIVQWRSLNSVYQPVWAALRGQGAEQVIILTYKNREATVTLCHHFELPVLNENVYAGDHGTTKIENLLQIQDRFKKNRYTFVDDSLANLQELDVHFNAKKPVLDLFLASWGYIGPDDASLAQKAGYPFITQEDLIVEIDTKLH
jgi:hypothetical protein